MSDDPIKLDPTTRGAIVTGLITLGGFLLRIFIGRALRDIDTKLAELPKLRDEISALHGQLADCRTGILVLQTEVENLKTPLLPRPSPVPPT